MTTQTKPSTLLPLVARLLPCPSLDNSFSKEMLNATWERFRQLAWESGDELTPAALAGLILYDDQFAQLLNKAERSQMVALARVALERYQQKTNPPNKLGKIIAAALKEKEKI